MRLLIAVLAIYIANLLLRSASTDAAPGPSTLHFFISRLSISSSDVAANLPKKVGLIDRDIPAHEEINLKGRIAFTVIASCCLLWTAILLGTSDLCSK